MNINIYLYTYIQIYIHRFNPFYLFCTEGQPSAALARRVLELGHELHAEREAKEGLRTMLEDANRRLREQVHNIVCGYVYDVYICVCVYTYVDI